MKNGDAFWTIANQDYFIWPFKKASHSHFCFPTLTWPSSKVLSSIRIRILAFESFAHP